MVRNGKTAAGRQRWLCKSCRATATHRIDNEAKLPSTFMNWLLSSKTQAEGRGAPGRSGESARSSYAMSFFHIKEVSMAKTAVLVEGGLYRIRANALWGKKTGKECAEELNGYVFKHLKKKEGTVGRNLYRVLHYECPPMSATVYHPLSKKNVDFGKSDTYDFATELFDELKRMRKYALRMGKLSPAGAHYELDHKKAKKLCSRSISIEDLEERDFRLSLRQKDVDMKLGLDIFALAYEHLVDQIILIAGDSDFVPAAKIARRKGIDFILDPMGDNVSPDLLEHIDGMESLIDCYLAKKRSSRKRNAEEKVE